MSADAADLTPAETFPLGDFLRAEMDARDMGLHDLYYASGPTARIRIPRGVLRRILRGGHATQDEIAAIARTLGVDPILLAKLQGAHIAAQRKKGS